MLCNVKIVAIKVLYCISRIFTDSAEDGDEEIGSHVPSSTGRTVGPAGAGVKTEALRVVASGTTFLGSRLHTINQGNNGGSTVYRHTSPSSTTRGLPSARTVV
ncbi:hypothetical protein J6590_016572 [Homalodisca vitripennis]|nr:hypothetical protein J6590_016572 [Homalodisca vitripennis]